MSPRYRLIVLALILLGIAGCASATMSPARRQRISECLKQCEARGATTAPDGSDGRGGVFDPRRDCERRCHQMK